MKRLVLVLADAVALWLFFRVVRYWEWRTGRRAWVAVSEAARVPKDAVH